MRGLWIQSSAGRAWASFFAIDREVRRLAERAGCSIEEARRHRQADERFCELHGWYSAALCLVCKEERRRARVRKAG
jgi:hypothetical protein